MNHCRKIDPRPAGGAQPVEWIRLMNLLSMLGRIALRPKNAPEPLRAFGGTRNTASSQEAPEPLAAIEPRPAESAQPMDGLV